MYGIMRKSKIRKCLSLIVLGFFVSGCMASFPTKYEPSYKLNPQFGKERGVYATAKALTAFGTESRDLSLRLQVLVDKKIEDWGYNKDRKGKIKLDITVQNVVEGGSFAGGMVTAVLCGLTFFVFPSIAMDNYQMTAIINEEGKEPITRVYKGSITTVMQIFFIMWGVIAHPIGDAVYQVVDNMLDHLMNDLGENRVDVKPPDVKPPDVKPPDVKPPEKDK
jgi:hypothetical protein